MRRTLLSFLALVAMLSIAAPAWATETIDWAETPPESGTRAGSEVEIVGPGTFRIVTIHEPGIVADQYEVSGTLRHSGVDGVAYLEMWSYFGDGDAYFSRTLATEGPRASISGDSSGREFLLPFSLNGSAAPARIEVNVVLPADGTVWVGPLDLEGVSNGSIWWSERTSSVMGGSLGIAAGLSGAVIGLLSGRRRARRAVVGLLVGGMVVGLLSLVAGGAAALWSQPRHVWYPLVLIGAILMVVDGALLPTTRRSYAAAELHRMRALDAQ